MNITSPAVASSAPVYHTETKPGELTFEEALADIKLYASLHDTSHWVYDAEKSKLDNSVFAHFKSSYESLKQSPHWFTIVAKYVSDIPRIDLAFQFLANSETFQGMMAHTIDFYTYHIAKSLMERVNEAVYLQDVAEPANKATSAPRKMNKLVTKVAGKAAIAGLRDRQVLSNLHTVQRKVPLILKDAEGFAPAVPKTFMEGPITAEPEHKVEEKHVKIDEGHVVIDEKQPKEVKGEKSKKDSDYKSILKGLKMLKTDHKSKSGHGGGHSSSHGAMSGGSHGSGDDHDSSDHEEESHSDTESESSESASSASSSESEHDDEGDDGGEEE